MRIFFLSTWFPWPPDNGSKTRAYHLLRALASAHEVTLVAFQPVSSDHARQLLRAELAIEQVHGVPVDPFRYVRIPQVFKFCSPIPLAYWPSRHMQQTVKQLAGSSRWDVVIAIDTPSGRYALQLPGIYRILDVHMISSYQMYERYKAEEHLAKQLRTWASWQKSQRYETRLLSGFQACTVVSEVEAEYLGSRLGDSGCRVVLSPNGVDCEHYRPGLAQPQPATLVFNGALGYGANYDAMEFFLADIYPQIRQQVPDVSLAITGSTTRVDLARLTLDASTRLTGYVDDVRPEVAGAWACVVPLREGGGTRLKILEAMALGTPVVATSKGAEGLDVTPNYDILIADQPAEFATQVVRLLRDSSLRQRLAANARRLVEQRYDWSQIGGQFVDLVEDVAHRSAPKGSLYHDR